ncbi:MAG: UDP-N-acetylmuramoyl-L-alanine--D-glutamate ligase [Candidatus Woesebacteria bacterium]|nr:UDP-N-acetylmuramoyl-L-alanine--D-glutamate ligase [Candidatus Woesebacteria bacterium]
MKNILGKFKDKRILILGFGEEGISTYRIIKEEFPFQNLAVADLKEKNKFEQSILQDIEKDKNTTFIFGKDYLSKIDNYDVIIKSPGISPTKIVDHIGGDKTFITQTEIFFEECQGKIIGVTGTKGKTTTSTLIYEILKKAGLKCYLVGNIGQPALEVLKKHNDKDSLYIYELSSHQLAGLKFSPHISIILNIGTDHLDWHGSQEEYVKAKENILMHHKVDDIAILNHDDKIVRELANLTKAKSLFFSLEDKKCEAFFDGDLLRVKLPSQDELTIDPRKILLRGKHNWLNILAASIAAKELGVENKVITDLIYSFKGLEHRLEPVAKIKGVTFINDSISTNPTSLQAAINSFLEPITLIMGGFDRGLDYQDLAKEIVINKQVKRVIIIGEVGPKMIRSLNKAGFRGSIINLKQKPMAKIVGNAFRNTPRGGVVLLSPAAASFDMFKDYKDRGNQFKKAIQALSNEQK